MVILETPYYSLTDVAKLRFSMFPTNKLLRYDFPSYKFIQKGTCPITIFHGTNDAVVPYTSGEKLFNCMPQKEKSFFTIENGAHNNLIEFETYRDQISKILL